MIKARFWGVRGSVPAPLTAKQVEEKIIMAVNDFYHLGSGDPEKFLKNRAFSLKGTYGGNTSCVELLCGEKRIVLDMGTGLRPLGNSLFPEMMKHKQLDIHFLLSHVHWDHIQGLPFFGPLYINKALNIKNTWSFYGGTDWMKNAEACLRGQMDPPNFPISWEEIRKLTHELNTHDVYDMKSFAIGDILIKTRKLNHPQETYGWRIQFGDAVVVYTTDNEPYDPLYPDARLLDLVKGADLWITDCQYTKDIYEGRVGGVPRHGWGHSYPEAVAETVVQGKVKQVVLFHHDPASSDLDIYKMEQAVQRILLSRSDAKVVSAHEGLEINVEPGKNSETRIPAFLT